MTKIVGKSTLLLLLLLVLLLPVLDNDNHSSSSHLLGLNCLKCFKLQTCATLSVKNVESEEPEPLCSTLFLMWICDTSASWSLVRQFIISSSSINSSSSIASLDHLWDRPTSTCWADDIHNKTSQWRDKICFAHGRLAHRAINKH